MFEIEADVTKQITINPHLIPNNNSPLARSFRVTMFYRGKIIGVLKSDGWELNSKFRIRPVKHIFSNFDNSWFKVFMRLD